MGRSTGSSKPSRSRPARVVTRMFHDVRAIGTSRVDAAGSLVREGVSLKLGRALYVLAGLTSAACGDIVPDLDAPNGPDAAAPAPDATTQLGDGDGGGAGGAGGADVRRNAARIVTAPPVYAVTNERYRYEPRASSKARSMEMRAGPKGMVLSAGKVEWSPAADQTGRHRIVLRAESEHGDELEQEFEVEVATSTLVAEGEVASDTGGVVVAATPRSGRMLGAGVQVPARALKSSTNLTVSELDRAPLLPNARGKVNAVRFGPSGLVFAAPARVSLPLPEGAGNKARLNAYVYNPRGRWERTRVLAVDLEIGLLTAEAPHFSIYAAAESNLTLATSLGRAGETAACAGELAAHATIDAPLSSIELASVNILSATLRAQLGENPSLHDLLALPDFRGSLRAVQLFELLERQGEALLELEQRMVVTTLHAPGDGSVVITHGDELGNVLASKGYANPRAELAEIEQRLRGAATVVHFQTPASDHLGVAVRVHFAYYPGDAALDPVSIDDLGLAAVDEPALFGAASAPADADCDGLGDAFDGSDDRLLAAIEATPRALTRAFAGEAVALSARVLRGQPTESGWTLLSSEGAQLDMIADAPDARTFRATSPGRYLVLYRAELADTTLEHVFAIDVLGQAAVNSAPVCTPLAQSESGRQGEAMAMSAVLRDEESDPSSLRVEWGLVGGTDDKPALMAAPNLVGSGGRALLVPHATGKFTVGCRAFDGQAYGAIGTVDVSVLGATQNRAPELVLSPLSHAIARGDALTFNAWARDADGDPLTFEWQVEGAEHGAPQTVETGSSLRVSGSLAGLAQVTVRVSDGKAPPVQALARLIVNGDVMSDIDADLDGWPAGSGPLADCNDDDAKIYPGAAESCADASDRNCDGIVRLSDCDDDHFTVEQGDCDDADARRSPSATELCDAVDNDCDGTIDDGWAIASRCVQGRGECQSFGAVECTADGLGSLCVAPLKMPSAERCDGLDNDCDGSIDEESVCGTPDAGVPDAGVGDASIQSDGGCVYRPEVCDGLDNDCNGRVDDLGGSCATGLPDRCGQGVLRCSATGLECDPPVYPEICNQVDDDCDGVIDDNLVCSCDPRATEHCQNGIDDDCDGLVDSADPSCTQSCSPTAIEYCFDRIDNDCDGTMDLADRDCAGSCQAQGSEICGDGTDNDCDGLLDGNDEECMALAVGESCINPHGVNIGEWNWASLRGHTDDIQSSCYPGGTDYVFRFDVREPGAYTVHYQGGEPHAWALFSGTCSDFVADLKELACKDGTVVQLAPGTYFLVVEGAKEGGEFGVVVQPYYGRDAG